MHRQNALTALDAKLLHEHRLAVQVHVQIVLRLILDPGASRRHQLSADGRSTFPQQMGESVEACRMVEFGQDHQIEPAVVEQSVRAKRHAASGLPAVADRKGHERSFPREAFRTKAATVRRELGKARDAGEHIGQSAQAPLKLRVGFHGNARTEAARYEVYERLAVENAHVDPSRRSACGKLQGGGQILHRHARRVSKIVGCAQRKDAKRTLLWETRTVSRGEYLVDCAVTAAGYDTADFACAGVGHRVSR